MRSKANNYNWEQIQERHNDGINLTGLSKEFNIPFGSLRKYMENGFLVKNKNIKRKQSEETKKILSEKRKKFLQENPEKHFWRSSDKFKSVPCENVKSYLLKLGVDFIEEFCPNIENRSFSIDIAIPDKMIAIEINGSQHYERDGSLKEYYQIRHDLLVANGWTVYEIHYSFCFNFNYFEDFIPSVISGERKNDFSYKDYTPKKGVSKKNKCHCGNDKYYLSKECKECSSKKPKYKKINWPSNEDLTLLLSTTAMSSLSKTLGVSGNAIKKHCVRNNIPHPKRGFRSSN